MRAVDTNVLVRLVVRDDEEQTANADRYIAKGGWVSILAVAETVWVLQTVYEREAGEIAAAIDLLLQHTTLTLQDEEVIAAALVQFRARPSVGFTDCLLLELARKAGHLPLGTFDRDLAKLEGTERL